MRATVLYKPGDIRFEERAEPKLLTPTDAIIRLSATCVCGSDLWPYRGVQEVTEPTPMGHEYCGIVEEIGSAVTSVKPGQFVIGSFFASAPSRRSCGHECFALFDHEARGRDPRSSELRLRWVASRRGC